MGDTQTMNKMELPMSIFVSATSREDSVPDDDSDLQAAAFPVSYTHLRAHETA